MLEFKIDVSTNLNKTDWSGFINRNRYNEIGLSKIELLNIDFSNCKFIEPYHIVSLACLIEEYYNNNVAIVFTRGNGLELNEYLSSIKFFNYWSSERNISAYLPSTINTTLNLWKISDEMISNYSSEAQKYYDNNYIQNKNLLPLATALSELFLNISDHSHSLISGFCLTQFYPNVSKIKIAVCDFGIGIPNSINNHLKSKGETMLSDTECLLKAFELNFTTQSTPRNRGRGLDTIKTIIIGNSGTLRVVSNTACYTYIDSKETDFLIKNPFNGTHFEIILDVNNLSNKDEELEDFDFS